MATAPELVREAGEKDDDKDEAESEDPATPNVPRDRHERQAFFASQRSVTRHLTEIHAALGTAAPATPSTVVNPQQWTFIGPQPMVNPPDVNPWAGSVLSLVMDPHNSRTIYAGTFVGKLWKTTDGGTTWQPLSDNGPLVDVQWITIDPVAQNTLYVMDAGAIYKSADGGSSWTELPAVTSDATCSGEAFAIHPSISGIWLASEYCSDSTNTAQVYKTTNSGSTWSKVATVNGEIDQISFHPSTPADAYFSGVNGEASFFETSTDSGSTWIAANGSGTTTLPQTAAINPFRAMFAAAPSNPKIIYYRVETFSGAPQIMALYKSTDGGVTWNLTAYPPEGQGPRTPALTAIDPTNSSIVYAGAVKLQRSPDGGSTWFAINGADVDTQIHGDNHAMIFSPDGNTAYESNDGGVWSSTNFRTASSATVSWTSLNNGFGTAEFRSQFAIDPTNSNRAFGGLQDNSTVEYTGSLGWTRVGLGGDGHGTAINPVNPSMVFSINDDNLWRSTAGGASGTWTQLPNPFPSGGTFVMDLKTPSTLYAFSSTGSSQSQNDGNSWQTFGPPTTNQVTFLTVAPSDSNTVAVIADFQLWITHNAVAGSGATWTQPLPIYNAAGATLLVGSFFDPSNSSKIYALGEIGAQGAPSLLTSQDGGMSWQAVNPGPSMIGTPRTLIVDPDLANTLYLATSAGVWRSSNGGSTWFPLGSSFPMVDLIDMEFHEGARILRTSTMGRGMWDLAIPTTVPRLTSVAMTAGSSGFLLTVNGKNFAASSAIWLNGNPVTTTFVNSAQLTAALTSSQITPSTVYNVSVNTPGSGGGLSDPLQTGVGPTIFPGGIVNAASPVSAITFSSFATQASPGMFTAIYGAQLAQSSKVASEPYPNSLGGVQVLVSGTPAPLYYVSPGQINFVIPWGTVGTQAIIVVENGTASSNSMTIPLNTAPEIFTTNQAGSGQGAVIVANTSIITAPAGMFPGSRPAAKGEYISIYATGLGAVQTTPADGMPVSGLVSVSTPPTVNIGCLNSSGALSLCPAPIQFAGLAPGYVGLYQVNIQVPSLAISGPQVPLQFNSTQTGGPGASNIVTIAIQ